MHGWWTKWLGLRGEDFAARYLKRRGFRILQRNARLAGGELDLIARLEKCLIFVEVKTRTTLRAGTPAEAVSVDKQRQLSRLATAWLQRHGLLNSEYRRRFDVIAVTWQPGAWWPRLEHYPNAFEADSPW